MSACVYMPRLFNVRTYPNAACMNYMHYIHRICSVHSAFNSSQLVKMQSTLYRALFIPVVLVVGQVS